MRVLVLGGTGEARELASRLTDLGHDVVSSLAGRLTDPLLPAGAVRVGGFGGPDGLREHLLETAPDLVVDATHPFAATITGHATSSCAATSTPLVVLRRPGWTAGPDDRWTRVPSVEAAAAWVRADAAGTVLLTIGRRDVAAFADDDVHPFVVRSVEPPTGRTPPRTTLLLDRGPYALDTELAVLRDHEVRLLVTKDSGGAATQAKLEAARQLELPVLMIDRPPLPAGVTVLGDVEAVLRRLPAHDRP